MIDAHRRDVLLHRQLHNPLEYPHRVISIEFDMLRDVVNGERLIVVIGNKSQLRKTAHGVRRYSCGCVMFY